MFPMLTAIRNNALKDPRFFQIVTLTTLLMLQILLLSLSASWLVPLTTLSTALVTQALFSRLYKIKFDPSSPLITALSLSILLKSAALPLIPLAAIIAIASKFLIRANNKHIFNPANLGIVAVLLLLPNHVWISPAQWGSAIWLLAICACFATFVLYKVKSRITSFAFLGFCITALLLRALWLGDPLAIPLHQLQSGALLIFTFFMIPDPKTTPDTKTGQIIFALSIAALAFIFQFTYQIREAPFYALAIACVIRPAIEKSLKEQGEQHA